MTVINCGNLVPGFGAAVPYGDYRCDVRGLFGLANVRHNSTLLRFVEKHELACGECGVTVPRSCCSRVQMKKVMVSHHPLRISNRDLVG